MNGTVTDEANEKKAKSKATLAPGAEINGHGETRDALGLVDAARRQASYSVSLRGGCPDSKFMFIDM
jgi:hypothetical protein